MASASPFRIYLHQSFSAIVPLVLVSRWEPRLVGSDVRTAFLKDGNEVLLSLLPFAVKSSLSPVVVGTDIVRKAI